MKVILRRDSLKVVGMNKVIKQFKDLHGKLWKLGKHESDKKLF